MLIDTLVSAAEDSNVVEMGADEHYPDWTARTEAAGLICLCHEDVKVRSLSLELLGKVNEIRSAQFQLIYSVKFANLSEEKRISESEGESWECDDRALV